MEQPRPPMSGVLFMPENPDVAYVCYMQPIPLASLQEATSADTISPSSTESANNVETILGQVHEDFRKLLHLTEILPSLNKRSLLTSNEMETLQGMAITNQQKVDKLLLEILPRKGMNILGQLIDCLHESKPGTGSAHVELAEKLEDLTGNNCALKSVIKREEKPSRGILADRTNLRDTVEKDSLKLSNQKDEMSVDIGAKCEPVKSTLSPKPPDLTKYGTRDIRSYFQPEPANM